MKCNVKELNDGVVVSIKDRDNMDNDLSYIRSYIMGGIVNRDCKDYDDLEKCIELVNKFEFKIGNFKSLKNGKLVNNRKLIDNVKLSLLNGLDGFKVMDKMFKVEVFIDKDEDLGSF